MAMLCVCVWTGIGLPCSSSRKANRRWTLVRLVWLCEGSPRSAYIDTLAMMKRLFYGLSMYWAVQWMGYVCLFNVHILLPFLYTHTSIRYVGCRSNAFFHFIYYSYMHININVMCACVCVYSGRDAIKVVSPEAIVFSLLCWFVAVSFIVPSFCPHCIHAWALLQFYLFSSTSACVCVCVYASSMYRTTKYL